MRNVSLKIQRWLSLLWTSNRPLTFVGLLMVCDLGACLITMIFDSRQITGINAWIKPAKFALSSAVTCFSLAWIANYLVDWPKIRAWSGRVFAASIALEIVLIDLQAACGTSSHFNMAGTIDRVAFITIGFWFIHHFEPFPQLALHPHFDINLHDLKKFTMQQYGVLAP